MLSGEEHIDSASSVKMHYLMEKTDCILGEILSCFLAFKMYQFHTSLYSCIEQLAKLEGLLEKCLS